MYVVCRVLRVRRIFLPDPTRPAGICVTRDWLSPLIDHILFIRLRVEWNWKLAYYIVKPKWNGNLNVQDGQKRGHFTFFRISIKNYKHCILQTRPVCTEHVHNYNMRVYSLYYFSGATWWIAYRLIMQYENSNLTVSVGVSHIDKTSVVFMEPKAKVNSQYYW